MEIDLKDEDSSKCNSNKRKHSDIDSKESSSFEKSKKVKAKDENDKDSNEKAITGTCQLNKYCMQNKLLLPCYKIYETTDYTNKKLFYVQCNIKTLIENATGNKKKEGKHKAASLLLAKLKNNAKFSPSLGEFSNMEVDLEEGEIICDLEDGEITEATVERTSNVENDLNDEHSLPMGNKKYKSYKVYLEGNVCKSNIISQQGLTKTDVEKLSDFCLEQQLPAARYEIEEHSGFSVSIFTCKCTVLQLSVNSRGPSRSAAKNRASKMLLEKMLKLVDLLKPDESGSKKKKYKKFDLEEGEILDDENENKGNDRDKKYQVNQFKYNKTQMFRNLQSDSSVSELYKYCMKLNIPPPTYEMVTKETITPVRNVVTFRCSVLRFSRVGKGSTKRQAVHKAASRVLQILINLNKDEVDKQTQDKDDDGSEVEEGEFITKNDEAIKKAFMGKKLQGNYVSYKQKDDLQLQSITNCHNIIKTEVPYKNSILIKNLTNFDDTVLQNNALLILEYLCKELDCTYDLYDLKSATCCLASVSLNTTPPWAFFGEGNSKINAELHAIFKLLQFLKIMNT